MSTGRFAFHRGEYLSDKIAIFGAPVMAVAAIAFAAAIAQGASANTVDGDGHGIDSPAYVSGLAPAKRVEHDFASRLESGDDCFEATGYDPFDYKKHGDARKSYAIGGVSIKNGIIEVVPGDPNKGEPALEFLPGDGSAPLQAANPATSAVLARLGCELQY